jgi:uncharacterized protein YigE (DUF2233 family)
MTSPRLLVCALLILAGGAWAADATPSQAPDAWTTTRDLSYAKRAAVCPVNGGEVTAHLAFFDSRRFRLKVIDLGASPEPSYPTLADAFQAEGAVAGVNGGFFHPDWRPSGLVIAEGRRINRFETPRLLSGVVYSDSMGTQLVRRGQFQDHAGIQALLQSGPYLVEGGRPVRGLSAADPNRRTFIATDWRGHWVLGATLSPLSLADLAECLASPGALTPWRVDRALNLDGGSSTGFFFGGQIGRAEALLHPGKRVRNLLGVVPR